MRVSILAQSKTNLIKITLKAAFTEQLKGVFIAYRRAPRSIGDNTHLVYELRQLTTAYNVTKYRLEVNLWSRADFDKLDELADKVENMLHFAGANLSDGSYIKIYKDGQREPVDDSDKDINRIRINFELQHYEGEKS